jgi:hypothetical protein
MDPVMIVIIRSLSCVNPILLAIWEQYYEGYFWRKNNKTGAAGSFSQNTGRKRSFYMLKK